MVTTVSNRARSTAAALGLDVDAIVAQHDGQILSVKDVEAYAAFEQAQKLIEKSAGMRVGVFVRVRMRCLLRRHAH